MNKFYKILITIQLIINVFSIAYAQEIQIGVQLSPLAGAQYYQLNSLISSIKIGDELQLLRETNNKHDKYAIKVLWQEKLLGYVPRSENQHLAEAMDTGHKLFAKVTNIKYSSNPWEKLEINIWLRF